MTSEAVTSALRKIGDFLRELSAHEAVGIAGWKFLPEWERVTVERDMLLWKWQNGMLAVGCYEEGKKVVKD